MKLVLFVVILVVTPFKPCDSARILGVVSFPSYSHQVVFQPVWRELSLRGHQVTTIVTDSINDTSLTNLTEIVIKEAYTSLKKHNLLDADATHGFIKMIDTMINMAEDLLNVQYSHPQVQRLIHNRSELFDLVIFEALSPTVVYAWRFDCPAIGLSSLDAGDLLHSVMGNPTNPIANPDPRLKIQDDDNLTFKERLYSVVTSWFSLVVGVFKITPMVDKIQQKYFGESVPPFFKLIDKVEMIMIATNPIFHATRPLNPNTITIGSGIHILPPKPLPNVS